MKINVGLFILYASHESKFRLRVKVQKPLRPCNCELPHVAKALGKHLARPTCCNISNTATATATSATQQQHCRQWQHIFRAQKCWRRFVVHLETRGCLSRCLPSTRQQPAVCLAGWQAGRQPLSVLGTRQTVASVRGVCCCSCSCRSCC